MHINLKKKTLLLPLALLLTSSHTLYAAMLSQEAMLIEAVKKNDATRIEQLINDGANVNQANKFGVTPLYWAA